MSIALRSRRGPIGEGWHALALRRALEAILGSSRAASGRSTARAGRVQWLDVQPGSARGAVSDADGALHQARLDLPPLPPGDREVVLAAGRARPELPARLVAGQYPQELEQELAASEVSLLPRSAAELSHDCSCPDWPGPCRHVAALAYVLVEAVDAEPVHLLTLRGLALQDLVAPARSADRPAPAEDPGPAAAEEAGVPGRYDPARTDPAHLAEVIGEDAAQVIAAFYRSGP